MVALSPSYIPFMVGAVSKSWRSGFSHFCVFPLVSCLNQRVQIMSVGNEHPQKLFKRSCGCLKEASSFKSADRIILCSYMRLIWLGKYWFFVAKQTELLARSLQGGSYGVAEQQRGALYSTISVVPVLGNSCQLIEVKTFFFSHPLPSVCKGCFHKWRRFSNALCLPSLVGTSHMFVCSSVGGIYDIFLQGSSGASWAIKTAMLMSLVSE